MDFDEYYDAVVDALVGMDETRKPDRGTVRDDYEADFSPEQAAQSFYDDWNLD